MSRVQVSVIAFAVALAIGGGAFYAGRSTSGHASDPAAATAAAAPSGRAQGPLLARPDGPRPALRQAGQVARSWTCSWCRSTPTQASDSGVKVSPQVQQNLGIRTATVQARRVSARRSTRVGTVQFDERLNVAVQTRIIGLRGAPCGPGAHGARRARDKPWRTIFAPEWLGPQNEIAGAEARRRVARASSTAARERTARHVHSGRAGSPGEAGGARTGAVHLVRAGSGVVAELGVREGVGRLPRDDAVPHRRPGEGLGGGRGAGGAGRPPDAGTEGQGGASGRCLADVRRRAEGNSAAGQRQHPHAAGALRGRQQGRQAVPGMLLRLQIAGPTMSRLVVPAEAVIRTGTRAVAIVRKDDGSFEPREVMLGADLGDRWRSSRSARRRPGGHQRPVPHRLGGSPELGAGRMAAAQPPAPASAACGCRTSRRKARSRASTPTASPSPWPVPTLKWPAMTMGFGKADPKAFPTSSRRPSASRSGRAGRWATSCVVSDGSAK